MTKPKLSLKPRKAKAVTGVKAWWYENESSIDVLVEVKPGTTVGQVHISRRAIESWLKKLEPKP